jgi:hypothetical protein
MSTWQGFFIKKKISLTFIVNEFICDPASGTLSGSGKDDGGNF